MPRREPLFWRDAVIVLHPERHLHVQASSATGARRAQDHYGRQCQHDLHGHVVAERFAHRWALQPPVWDASAPVRHRPWPCHIQLPEMGICWLVCSTDSGLRVCQHRHAVGSICIALRHAGASALHISRDRRELATPPDRLGLGGGPVVRDASLPTRCPAVSSVSRPAPGFFWPCSHPPQVR